MMWLLVPYFLNNFSKMNKPWSNFPLNNVLFYFVQEYLEAITKPKEALTSTSFHITPSKESLLN